LCVLCGDIAPKHRLEARNNPNPEAVVPYDFLCSTPPNTNVGCVNEIDTYRRGMTRLEEVTDMQVAEIKQILRDREVPVMDGEDKESLVLKGQKKG